MLGNKLILKVSIKLLQKQQDKSLIRIIMNEGRNRQIRRIAEIVGYPVIDLKRTGIEHISLNELEEGAWRELELNEWSSILEEKKHQGTSNED